MKIIVRFLWLVSIFCSFLLYLMAIWINDPDLQEKIVATAFLLMIISLWVAITAEIALDD